MAKEDRLLQDIQRDNLRLMGAQPMAERAWPIAVENRQELVEPPMAAERVAIRVTTRKRKHKALLSQESNGEGSAESKPEMGNDTIVVGGVDEMLTTLQRGNGVNPV